MKPSDLIPNYGQTINQGEQKPQKENLNISTEKETK